MSESDHGLIYQITSPSGKSYVGQTRLSLKQRMASHFSKKNGCTVLKNAIKKYGRDQMKIEIIWKGPVDNLNEKECFFIKQNNTLVPNGYNLMTGGGSCGRHHKETRKQLSITMKKKHSSGALVNTWNPEGSKRNKNVKMKISNSL